MILTTGSINLLAKIIKEAEYEGENGMNEALMHFSKAERGNLTDLKKKGYVSTAEDDGGYTWVILEEESRQLYKEIRS